MKVGQIEHTLARAKQWLRTALAPGGGFEQDGLTYRGLLKAPLGPASVGLFTEGVRCAVGHGPAEQIREARQCGEVTAHSGL